MRTAPFLLAGLLLAAVVAGLPSAAAADTGVAVPPPCGPTALCTGPHCGEQDAGTATAFAVLGKFLELGMVYVGPHGGVRLNEDCSVTVWETGLDCQSHLLPLAESQVRHDAGAIEAAIDACAVGFICACMPADAASASSVPAPAASAIEPPVEVEFVDCVTAPCPPIVRCGEREAHVPFVTDAYVERDCDVVVGLVDAYRICPGLHQQLRPSAGPVTLVVNYCAPTLDCTCDPMPELLSSSSASLQPPIYCVMAPCGPQCIVPCVPQVIPSACELRQATPDRVGPLLIPANPRTMVWGSNPYDCTVDVDPAYECVGGWGFDRHVTAAFVDVVVRVCTGGPFPPPIVQDVLDDIQLQ